MSNISLLGIELIICLITIPIIYKIYKTEALYLYSIIAFILSNFMSLKTITIYNFDINLGIIPLISVFIASNIIIQKKGKEEIKNLILALITSSILSYGILYIVSKIDSSNITLFTNKSYDNILTNSARIYFANIVTILYTLLLNSKLYYSLKIIKNNIAISTIFTSIIIQFISSILFPVIAYTFIKEPIEIIKIIVIRYIISLIVSIFGTISIYITNKLK